MSDTWCERELELEAYPLGGVALVDSIHQEASEYVERHHPWDGEGPEPAERGVACVGVWRDGRRWYGR